MELETYYTDNMAYPARMTSAGNPPIHTISDVGVVQTTKGNVFTYNLNTAGSAYCISGDNPNNSSRQWFYDSSQGGLLPATVTACPTGDS